MSGQKVFICGVLTGFENNRGMFVTLAALLSANGFEPVHPYQLFPKFDSETVNTDEFRRECTKVLANCHRVITVRGWEQSALMQDLIFIARRLEIPISPEATFFNQP